MQMFFKIMILKNFANFTGKHECWSFFITKLQALKPATLLKTESRYFSMIFATSKEHLSFTEHLRWVLLKIMNSNSYLKVLSIVATK